MTREPNRCVRVSDELWERAQSVARANGDSLSQVMRDALESYVAAGVRR